MASTPSPVPFTVETQALLDNLLASQALLIPQMNVFWIL
jgi:hypothetical protein